MHVRQLRVQWSGSIPRFSWVVEGSGRTRKQSAYRIFVGLGEDPLDAPVAWDSGTVESARTDAIPYAGEQLSWRARYAWRVQVRDEQGAVSEWSDPTWFDTGIDTRHWDAEWIAAPVSPRSERLPGLENVPRIRPADPDGSGAWFRAAFTVPPGPRPLSAPLVAVGSVAVYLNGSRTDGDIGDGAFVADVADAIVPGRNVLAVRADDSLVARLEVHLEGRLRLPHLVPVADEGPVALTTSGKWIATAVAQPDWERPGADDAHWAPADEIGLYGDPPHGRVALTDRPSPYLRRPFEVKADVARAKVYATAMGVYDLHINGQRISADRLSPGWTDYRYRITHQSYDVTGLLTTGPNVVSAILGDGWYAGNVSWFGPFQYGRTPGLRAELEIEYADGATERIPTSADWRVGRGAVRYADLQNGERHDARAEPTGWMLPGFDDSSWPAARVVPGPAGRLAAGTAPPIRVQHVLEPKAMWETTPGTWIADFGQNLVGWTKATVTGVTGQRLILRHAEVLEHDGTPHLANLRSARATDEYVLAGDATETFEPRFTVHGFRYVEITGPRPETIVAMVAYASMTATGDFSCSDERLNQLQSNIVWGQRGNFLTVPTDCPQRDERLGWTGDIWAFAPTALFNYDARAFLRSWLVDVADAQTPAGSITHVAPDLLSGRGPEAAPDEVGSPGWGDAVVKVPWSIFQAYGDPAVAEELYEPMRRWIAYLERRSDGYILPDEGFGDWLSTGAETLKPLVGTAVFALSVRQLGELARSLDRLEDAKHFDDLYGRVRSAFRGRFLAGQGRLTSGTQSAYVLALSAGMFDDHEASQAAAHLVDDIAAHSHHLSTGFLATPYLLDALTSTGHHDVSLRLLLQDTFPSWLYPIAHGDATTMWERWDSWSEHHGLQDPFMNSFNHYAYGAVGDWIYRTIGGLAPGSPGYRDVVIRPRPGGSIAWARTSYRTVHGPVSVSWSQSQDQFTLDATVPANVRAQVWVPCPGPDTVAEGGIPAAQAEGVRFERMEDGCAVFHVGSGAYAFQARN
ncbi:glycoside hydrolase family 78 protein [Streptomyces endocoffeicus]|nr:glycoside hydrolase family 78 protein [Streptomyces endocoffeicus]